MIKKLPFRLLTSLLGAAAVLSAAAQDSTATGKVPVFSTQARDVIVDVVVRKDNKSVKGLSASDFLVYEDGKPQKIDFFQEHTTHALPPNAVSPLPKMPPGVYTNVPAAPLDEAVDVLLLDSLNTEPADQINVHQQILKFLGSVRPGTRVAIFALGTRLHFVQGFTSDMSAILEALQDKKLHVGPTKNSHYQTRSDIEDDKETISILRSMLMGNSDAGIEAMQAALEDEGSMQFANRTAITLDALQFLARYLGNVPGRKNLIWFASSFPVNVFPSPQQQQDMQNERIYLSQVKKTADLLTVSRVAVYPIGAEGVMQNYAMSPENNAYISGADGANSSNGTRGAEMMKSIGNENSAHADNIFNMEQLAKETGGRAFYNTNDLSAAIEDAMDDGANYYTLTYSPTNKKMNGKFRKIEIKVAGKGYKLAYRQGYNADLTPGGKVDSSPETLRSLMVLGLPNATQILYGLRVAPLSPQPAPGSARAGKNNALKGDTVRYSVDFLVRWTDVRLEQLSNGDYSGKLQFEIYAYDLDGHPVNWTGGIQQMDLTPDLYKAIQASGIPGHFEIDLPKGKGIFFETGVLDWGTRKAGTLQFSVRDTGSTPGTTAHM